VVKHAPWVELDVHKQSCHATAVEERGEVVLQKKMLNEPEVLRELFRELKPEAVAMEARRRRKKEVGKSTESA
jgi:hypothetical protein